MPTHPFLKVTGFERAHSGWFQAALENEAALSPFKWVSQGIV